MSVTVPLRRGFAAACLMVCAATPAKAAASPRHDALESGIIRAMNQTRGAYGLPALHASSGLARAADAHSASMSRHNVLTHGAFSSRLRRYTRARRVGENLAWTSDCSAATIVQMWMNSAGHRRIMLSRSFRRVGVGRRTHANACFVTADFSTVH
jgi:uncharacterized protein YkwD